MRQDGCLMWRAECKKAAAHAAANELEANFQNPTGDKSPSRVLALQSRLCSASAHTLLGREKQRRNATVLETRIQSVTFRVNRDSDKTARKRQALRLPICLFGWWA